jgi:hypothetical protein
MKAKWICTAALVLTAGASAQQPSTAPEQIQAMQACSFMVGRWSGEGWMSFGPGPRHTFHASENIEPKLNGLLLEVQGLGTDETGRTVHAALAVLSFDAAEKRYHFRAYEQMGHYIDSVADCHDGAMTWSLPAGPRTVIQYTISLNPKGQWHETGAMTVQGQAEQSIFEMTLDKKSDK